MLLLCCCPKLRSHGHKLSIPNRLVPQIRDWEFCLHTGDVDGVLHCQRAVIPLLLAAKASTYAKYSLFSLMHLEYLREGTPHPLWQKVLSKDAKVWDEEDHEIFFGLFSRQRSSDVLGGSFDRQAKAYLKVRATSFAWRAATHLLLRHATPRSTVSEGDALGSVAVRPGAVAGMKTLLLDLMDTIKAGTWTYLRRVPVGKRGVGFGLAGYLPNTPCFTDHEEHLDLLQVSPILAASRGRMKWQAKLQLFLIKQITDNKRYPPTTWRNTLLTVLPLALKDFR